jgi:hypothetical protein
MLIHRPGLVDEPHYINAVNSIGLLEGVNPNVAAFSRDLDRHFNDNLYWDFDDNFYWDFDFDQLWLVQTVESIISFNAP